MRMKAAIGGHVVKLDGISILNEVWWVGRIPGMRAIDWLTVHVKRLRHVLKEPQVVLVLVWVESDLLLLTPGGVHKIVRVQVTSLSVVVSNGDSAAKYNIDWNILHGFGVESGLEFGAHESISITRVY